nr:MAG: NSP1a protein [Avian astrovirus 15]
MGTQGVCAQGYVLSEVFKTAVLTSTPTPPEVRETTSDSVTTFQNDQVDHIVERVIQGTKISHAALTSEMESMREKVNVMYDLLEKMQERIMQQHYRIMELEKPMVELEKKKGKNKHGIKDRFMKAKVLTEEEYKRMMDEGWTREQIMDAVQQLRDSAWNDYQQELEDWDADVADQQIEMELNQFVKNQALPGIVNGVKSYSLKDMIVMEVKKRVVKKRPPVTCYFCKKSYNDYHDFKECKKAKNSKRGDVSPPKN